MHGEYGDLVCERLDAGVTLVFRIQHCVVRVINQSAVRLLPIVGDIQMVIIQTFLDVLSYRPLPVNPYEMPEVCGLRVYSSDLSILK